MYLIEKEYDEKKERSENQGLNQRKFQLEYTLEAYPCELQPHINKQRILNTYDSLNYIEYNRNMILIGPTGVGKTGLATAFPDKCD